MKKEYNKNMEEQMCFKISFDYRTSENFDLENFTYKRHRFGTENYYVSKDILDKVKELLKDCDRTVYITEEKAYRNDELVNISVFNNAYGEYTCRCHKNKNS